VGAGAKLVKRHTNRDFEDMADLIDTTEMYLRTILELEEENIVPLRARISERLGQSGPTVSQTVGRMERDGLVLVSGDRHLELTGDGRRKATHVMRKHRLAERLLSDIIGLEWEFVHDEACRWEHVMSEQVERRILFLLGNPSESPYGNPIPGLADLGLPEAEPFLAGVVASTDLVAEQGNSSSGIIRRLGEPVQYDPELLANFRSAGVLPGVSVSLSRTADRVLITAQESTEILDLPLDVAVHIYIEPNLL
jgi:DtxR family Mn-dependent transcriptional regulator